MTTPSNSLTFITGASRGLGLGLARAAAQRGHHLIAIARQESDGLRALAAQAAGYRFVPLDLGDAAAVAQIGAALFGELAQGHWQKVVLIQNAGVIEPVGLAGKLVSAAITNAVQINLNAAMVLTNAFLAAFSSHAATRHVLHISSGAARNPMPGWSSYCASKAGLEMFTRCVAAEQALHANGARVAALAPGIVDTDMQRTIRAQGEADFPAVARFQDFHASGALVDADTCGEEILRLIDADLLEQGAIADIRDFRPIPAGRPI
jgi:sepiapterin reductase